MENYSLTIRKIYNAPVSRVFEAWIKSEQVKQWHCPPGMNVSGCEVDAKEGGAYTITMQGDQGFAFTAGGRVKEFVPDQKLVFSWESEADGKTDSKSLVTVLFKPLDPKQTELTLTHELFKSEQSKELHGKGWQAALSNLELLLSK